MKKLGLLPLCVALCALVCSCQKGEFESESGSGLVITYPDNGRSSITFSCVGEFEMIPFKTRALVADEKPMTDLWVLDYMGDELIQQIHQTSDDEDFGQPTMDLDHGDHHLYFIASRGQGATLSTENHTITFTRVLDTFYKDYEINVTATSNGSRSVALDRIVTKLTTVITDAIPEGAATFNITPTAWYYSFDYITGEPLTATANQTIVVNIPASEIGNTNLRVNIYGFSSATQWTTDISVNCKNSADDILGMAVINDVPFRRNHITQFSGPLFDGTRAMSISLNGEWSENIDGTW